MSGAANILAGAGPRYNGPYRCEQPRRWSLPRCEQCPRITSNPDSHIECPAPLTPRERSAHLAAQQRATAARAENARTRNPRPA